MLFTIVCLSNAPHKPHRRQQLQQYRLQHHRLLHQPLQQHQPVSAQNGHQLGVVKETEELETVDNARKEHVNQPHIVSHKDSKDMNLAL